MSSSIQTSPAVSNWIYLGLAVFIVSSVLLNNVNECGSVEFCAVTVFAVLFLITGFSILLLAFFSSNGMSQIGSQGSITHFMFQGLNLSKILWVPLGVILILGISWGVTFLDIPIPGLEINGAPFLGIFLSGFVIFFVFLQTNSALVPILTHGIYNSIVVALREGGTVIANVTPEVGVSLGHTTDFGFEMFLQLGLVAPAEEFFRIWAVIWVVYVLKGRINHSKSGYMWQVFVGVLVSNSAWTILHLVQF